MGKEEEAERGKRKVDYLTGITTAMTTTDMEPRDMYGS